MLNTLIKLAAQLMPSGRAFKMPKGDFMETLFKSLARSEERFWNDAQAIRNSMLPDNDGFTAEDATDWERRLGLISNSSVPLADRKAAILRKIKHPGTIRPRQSHKYIQLQLRLANFDVYVYENRFPSGGGYITKTPEEIIGSIASDDVQHASNIYHGMVQHGGTNYAIVANHIEDWRDMNFQVGSNYRSTFFIAGATVDTMAEVPLNRKNEFRQLILTLKPQQTIAYLFVNFTS